MSSTKQVTLVPDPQPSAPGQLPQRAWMQGDIEQRVPKHLATWLEQVGRPLVYSRDMSYVFMVVRSDAWPAVCHLARVSSWD